MPLCSPFANHGSCRRRIRTKSLLHRGAGAAKPGFDGLGRVSQFRNCIKHIHLYFLCAALRGLRYVTRKVCGQVGDRVPVGKPSDVGRQGNIVFLYTFICKQIRGCISA